MSDADRIAQLETNLSNLRHDLLTLGIAQLTQINLVRELLLENGWKRALMLGDDKVDAFDHYGEVFDSIMAIVDKQLNDS